MVPESRDDIEPDAEMLSDPFGSTDAPPALDADAFAGVPAPPPARRFCRRCGTLIEVEQTGCVRCERVAVAAVSSSRTVRYEEDDGPYGEPLSPAPFADVIGLYAVLLLTFLPIAFAAWTSDGEEVGVGVEMAVGIIDAVVVGFWAIARWGSIGPLLLSRFPAAWLAIPVGIAVASFAFAWAFVATVNGMFGVEEVRMTDSFTAEGYGLAMIVLFTCVQPAVIEELAFRGVIFNGLLSFLTRKETIIVSSLMFMVVHLTAFGVPQLLLGVVLALIRLRTGSLLPCMILHFAHNFLCIAQETWWS